MPDPSEKTNVFPVSALEESPETGGAENRVKARYSFTASAEVYELKSQTRVAGRCSDLSLGGCYIDTLSPFAVGSAVRVRIKHDSLDFQATAVVAYAHASMGMGVAFTVIKPEHETILRQWIANLSGVPLPEPEAAATDPEFEAKEAESNFRLVLTELITLLVHNKIITEKEGAELLFQTFR
jgi:hypothetical protein